MRRENILAKVSEKSSSAPYSDMNFIWVKDHIQNAVVARKELGWRDY